MTVADFKDSVAGYLNRQAAAVVTAGALDLILQAMNDARRAAQREYNFELNRQPVFGSLSMLGTSILSGLTATPGGSAVIAKRIDAVWEYSSTTISASTAYYRTKHVEFKSHAALKDSLAVQPGSTVLDTENDFVFLHGQKLYHSNLTTSTSFLIDAIVFLDDLAVGGTPDIFLTYFTDWLKFATLANLNVWLKDSQRTPIDQAVVSQLWDNVKRFDAQMGASTGSIDLE